MHVHIYMFSLKFYLIYNRYNHSESTDVRNTATNYIQTQHLWRKKLRNQQTKNVIFAFVVFWTDVKFIWDGCDGPADICQWFAKKNWHDDEV